MNRFNRIETVQPVDLLKALNTLQLQNQSYQEELSFGYHPQKPEKHLNFEIYMQKKEENPKEKTKTPRASVTPLKDKTKSISNRMLDKKSVSPYSQHPKRHDKINDKQNHLVKSSTHQKSQTKMANSKLSYQTRKILNDKQKKGTTYVPIQKRAEELLKERQQKLVKMQKEKEMIKILEEKQCTFKPKITKNYHKPTPPSKIQKKVRVKTEQSWIEKAEKSHEEAKEIEDSVIDPLEGEIAQEIIEEVAEPVQTETVPFRKYKNEKFNILLDFIH